MKKSVSVLLSLLIIFSISFFGTLPAKAASQGETVVSIARGQIGYHGRPNTFSNWMGMPDSDWCAAFACWCAEQAGVSKNVVPKIASSTSLLVWYNNIGRWHRKNGTSWSYGGKTDNSVVDYSYSPQIGDIILLETNSTYSDGPDHTAIVTGYNGSTVYTIEGNISGNQVGERSYSVSSSKIWGYCNPAYSGSVTPPVDNTNPDNYTVPARDIYYSSSNVMTGSDVSWIQAVLYQLGYNISIDGSFGPASKSVVQQFQSDYGLDVDGSVGPATRQKLIDLWTSKSFQACDVGTDFYAYITNTAYWLYLSNDYDNVSAKSPTYLTEQIWKFERQSDNSYVIKSSSNDYCLDVSFALAENQTNIQTFTYNGTDAQKWYLIKKGDNKYIFKSKLGNYVLDLAGGANVSGTNIQLYEPNGTDAQYFSIYKYDVPSKVNVTVETCQRTVRVKWNKVNGAARYDVYLIQSPYSWDDVKYSKKMNMSYNSCEFKNITPGSYTAFVVTKPNDNSVQSNWVDFSVTNNSMQPAKQIEFNGHIYSIYNDTCTWNEAKQKCEDMGGHLVTVTSEEEQEVVEKLIKGQYCNWYFMGANNIDDGTNYKWVTGEAFEYTKWRNGSPDNVNEHYLMTTKNYNGEWQDTVEDGYDCAVGFICEVEADAITPADKKYYRGHTYEVYNENLTWEDAEKYAELKDGHLVTVTNEAEKSFIDNFIQNGTKNYYWLGATNNKKNNFNWVTGESFDYSNWDENEPNNTNSIEFYLMQYKNSGKWNDLSNYSPSTGFVIEYDCLIDMKIADVDGNKNVDIKDVTEIQKHIASINTLDENALIRADVNSDGKVDIKDATLIQQYSAGLIEKF